MKKTAVFVLFFLVIINFPKPIYAIELGVIKKINPEIIQQITPTATPTTKITIAPLRKQIKEAKKEKNLDRVNEHFDTIKESLQTRHEFLVKIKLLVESKLGENIDAKAKFTGLEKLETDYLEDLNNFENKIGEILTSETPGKIIPELRTAVKAIRTDLNSIHKLLADTIKLLIAKP